MKMVTDKSVPVLNYAPHYKDMRESSDIIPRILILCLTWIKVANCTLRPRCPRTERPITARQKVWRA